MGAHLVKELLALGHTVVALDDLSGGFRDQVDPTIAAISTFLVCLSIGGLWLAAFCCCSLPVGAEVAVPQPIPV